MQPITREQWDYICQIIGKEVNETYDPPFWWAESVDNLLGKVEMKILKETD